MDQTNLLEHLISLLEEHGIHYCVIGGQAVNAYVEPLVSLDLDIVIAFRQLNQALELLNQHFTIERFPPSLNISLAGSDLRVQIQTDERYAQFVERASQRDVLGLELPVASLRDILQGKVWAADDPQRRGSKRQKDLADIARIIEKYPELRDLVPQNLQARLFGDSE